jgi:cytochrome P450
MSETKKLAGPRGWPILGVLPMLRRDTLGFLKETAATYGDIVPLRILMTTAYLLNHPSHVEHVLQTNHRNYRKAPMIDRLKPIFGEGLVTAQGECWSKQRVLLQPSFNRRKIDALASPMVATVTDHLKAWGARAADRGEFNLSDDISRLTLEIVLRTMFTASLGTESGEISKAMVLANEVISRRVWNLTNISSFMPTRKNRAFNAAVQMLHRVVARVIAERTARHELGDDLLGILLSAAASDPEGWLDDALLRDEVITLMLAGYESTATMVAWAIFLLSQHPLHFERMRSEIDEVLRGKAPEAHDLPRLEYTRRVIQEVGRLRPSIWWFARTAINDDEIGGQKIKAGTTVFISQYLLHTLPSVWQNPERFDPDRFLPSEVSKRSKFAYLPFGAGPRTCIGSGFAMMEMQIILSMIYQRFEVEITSDPNPEFGNFLSLRPTEDFRASAKFRTRH